MNSARDIGRWFRLQIEHVRRAIRTPVPAKEVFRHKEVQEQTLPDKPNVTLRRTITDEMIIKKEEK